MTEMAKLSKRKRLHSTALEISQPLDQRLLRGKNGQGEKPCGFEPKLNKLIQTSRVLR